MSNYSTVSEEDLLKYPSLKGKQVGDVITAKERNALSKAPKATPSANAEEAPTAAEAPQEKKSKK